MSSTADRFRKKSITTISIKDANDPDEEPYEFEIQKLSIFELIESQEMAETIGGEDEQLSKMEDDSENMTLKKLKSGVFPMMKKYIPSCTIKPHIVFDEESKDDNDVSHRLIPMGVLSELFSEILKFSGLDQDSVEKIKKKQQIQSRKTA